MTQLPAVEHVGIKVMSHPYTRSFQRRQRPGFKSLGPFFGFFNLDTLTRFEIHPDDLRWHLNVETLNLRL